jgi:hypothetical protein
VATKEKYFEAAILTTTSPLLLPLALLPLLLSLLLLMLLLLMLLLLLLLLLLPTAQSACNAC